MYQLQRHLNQCVVKKYCVKLLCLLIEDEKDQKKATTKIPTYTLEYFKRKCQKMLADIGDGWYLNTKNNPKHSMTNPRLSKKQQEGKIN